MGLLDRLVRRLGYEPINYYALTPRGGAGASKSVPLTDPPAFLRAEAVAEQYSIPDRSLPEAQLELYQRLTWVQIAVSTVASIGATTAFNVMALQGEDTADLPNHPFELLLRRPNPLHSRAEFLEGTLAYYALTGNAYWWLNIVGGKPAELWLLPPHKVKPVPDGRMFLRGYLYDAGEGDPIPLELSEVVHFRRFHPLNSFVGLSPIEALAVVATGDMAAQKWNTNFFNKDNAKIPGILSFADPIPDPDWERMKDGVREQYGGTKRNLMMLRGAGTGGVQWLATSMSQADMQFLDGRTFTKEEIFAIYAPGLSSMLAVNATEANSVSGKRTFIEYGVWPHLVRIAEKITNDLLPLYGSNLVGEFEDIRVTDKQLELAEISAYSQTHTVDEVRSRYYQDEPLGDDRGNLLVTEVGKGLTPADPEAQEIGKELQRRALEAPQQQEQDTEDAADESEPGDDNEDAQEETSHDNMGQMQAEGRQGETGRQQEVKALRRWLKNRRNPDPLKFKRLHLSADDVLDIAADMGIGEADTEQPPFTMTTTDGSNTRERWQAAIKALQLQLDPGDDDAAERVYAELERRGETAIMRAFREQWKNLLPPNAESMNLDELMAYVNARLIEQQPAVDAIARVLYDAAGAGVNVALDQLERIGIGFDYTLVNTRAQTWAQQYAGELIRGISDTTQAAVRQAVERWYGNGEPLSALVDDLARTFDRKRARLIAMTETTRAAAEGNRLGYKESGVVTGLVWKTANDELVCPHCGALNGAIVSIDNGAFYDELPAELQSKIKRRFETPPAHPGCRCRISAQVIGVGETVRPAQQQQAQVQALPEVAQPAPMVQPVQAQSRVFVPATDKAEVARRMAAYVNSYEMTDLSLDKQNAILKTVEDVLGGNEIKIESLAYQKKTATSYGVARSRDKKIEVEIQKTFLSNPAKKQDEQSALWGKQKAENIAKFTAYVNDPKRHGILDYNQRQLAWWSKAPRWSTFQDANVPIDAVVRHELYHAVDFANEIKTGFKLSDRLVAELDAMGVDRSDWALVSSYGGSKPTELFAELGAAIDARLDVPQVFIDAFRKVVR